MLPAEFTGVIGHAPILDVLARATVSPAPAYLFVGPAGLGKRLVAERFAHLLLSQPLDRPLSAHPDFVTLSREEGSREIVVAQARTLIERVSLTAMGSRTVVLVAEADRLNEEAANSLLKSVEEARPGLTFLFVADEESRLPATLRSRLVSVRFERVPRRMLVDGLSARGVSSVSVERAAAEARGCPGVALRLLEDPSSWQAEGAQSRELLQTLVQSPLGVQVAELERVAQSMEAQEDTEAAWRSLLQRLMQDAAGLLATQPTEGSRLAHGIIHAWRLAGSSLSPRLAFEWAAVRPSLEPSFTIPSSLTISYL